MTASSRYARLIGCLVFIVGIGLLVAVFFQARLELARPLASAAGPAALEIARQVGLLFIMGYAASSLAGRGCQLFHSSHPAASYREMTS